MRSVARWFLLGMLVPEAAPADALAALDADGWYTWRVAAVEGAPAWCCTIGGIVGAERPCRLDSRFSGYGDCGDRTTDGEVRLYAMIEAGTVKKLRVLDPECPVEAGSVVSDLGPVAVEESFNRLRRLVERDSGVAEDALAAIAVHRGEEPLRFLVDAARGGAGTALRKNAIFWLGQVRIAEGAPVIEDLMFAGDVAGIRRHAAFVLANSSFPARHEALIRQGRGDSDAEVRSNAWFWLAQTGAAESEQAIVEAMNADPDRNVREEAVFALSQLPGDRAVDALLELVEDPQLDPELRKTALFWLVQSESDRAFVAVERLLGANP